jgi:hypothetical protein
MVFRLGLPVIILIVGTGWFAWASYRRAGLGLRTLSSHPSVPRDVALTADLTLADIRRLTEGKELDH